MPREYKYRPKKTQYGDTIFRSKSEARWAVFFDCLGVEYAYEPEYAEVETGCRVAHYKPDFFLRGLDKYVEIKPSKPFETENIKAAGWSKYIGDIIVLFNLNPPSEALENGWMFSYKEIHDRPLLVEGICWGECPKCGYIDLVEYDDFTSCGCFSSDELSRMYEAEEDGIKTFPNFHRSERLLMAYKIAQNFSFTIANSNRASKLPIQTSIF